jgi:hypothetical protein
MAKHIVAPATAEEIARTLGVTREDREIVERILRELGEYDRDTPEGSTGSTTQPDPIGKDPEDPPE